jgi:hypothetical protein
MVISAPCRSPSHHATFLAPTTRYVGCLQTELRRGMSQYPKRNGPRPGL